MPIPCPFICFQPSAFVNNNNHGWKDLSLHVGLCTAARSGPAHQPLAWGHDGLVHNRALGEEGCFWGSDMQVGFWRLGKSVPWTWWMAWDGIVRALASDALCRHLLQHKAGVTCWWIPQAVFHTDAHEEWDAMQDGNKGKPQFLWGFNAYSRKSIINHTDRDVRRKNLLKTG